MSLTGERKIAKHLSDKELTSKIYKPSETQTNKKLNLKYLNR